MANIRVVLFQLPQHPLDFVLRLGLAVERDDSQDDAQNHRRQADDAGEFPIEKRLGRQEGEAQRDSDQPAERERAAESRAPADLRELLQPFWEPGFHYAATSSVLTRRPSQPPRMTS